MDERTCTIDGCQRRAAARTWCLPHYQRWYKTGGLSHAPARAATLDEQFWSKVVKADGCWLWSAYVMPNGYAQFSYGTRADKHKVLAHRFAYEAAKGPIPAGLHIDHLCRVRRCVNPDHLEAVTQRENNVRAGRVRRQRSTS